MEAANAPPCAGRLGRCRGSFYLAVLFDAVGLVALLAGVFADTAFADLLIYGGGGGMFFSLLWWVLWLVGNLEVPPAELEDDVGLGPPGKAAGRSRGLPRLVCSLSNCCSGPRAARDAPEPEPA